MTEVKMTVNGKAVSGSVEGRTLLAQFLRDDLELTGTRRGGHHRRSGQCRRVVERDPASLSGSPWPAVRVLHTRHDHVRRSPVEREPQTVRSGRAPLSGRQHLPLHRVSQHRQGDHGRIRPGRRCDCCGIRLRNWAAARGGADCPFT